MADAVEAPVQPPDQPQSVNVFNPYGQPENIPQDQLAGAMKVGYRVASPQDVTDWKLGQQYGTGVENPLKAFAAAAARTATFGLSDQFLTKSGAVDPQTLQALKKYNPVASTAGDVAGIAGSVLAGPELAPVKVASKLGTGVAEALAPAALEAGAEGGVNAARVLRQAGAAAAGSAVEAGAYGLGQSVTEQALGDPDLNAQKVLSNIGYGALWGGALGGLLKVGEEAAPLALDAAKNSLGKVNDVIFGNEQELGALPKAYSKFSSFVSGRPSEEIEQAILDRRLAATTPEEVHDLTQNFYKSLDDHFENIGKVLKDANGVTRPEETEALLKDVPAPQAFQKYTDLMTGLRDSAKLMRSEPDLYSPYYARTLEQIADRFGAKITTESSAHDVFQAMDELKGRLDQDIKYGRDIPAQEMKAQQTLKSMRSELKSSLEDEQLFGAAGARQSAFNDSQSGFLNITGKKGLFRKYFLEPQVSRTGAQVFKISPNKVKTFLGQLGNMQGDEKARALQQFLDSSDNVIKEVGKTYDTFGAEPINKKSLEDMVGTTKGLAKKAMDQVEYNKLLNRLGSGAHNTYLGENLALGLGMHHPLLGAAMETMNMGRNPGLFIQRLMKIESAVKKTGTTIEKGVKGIFKVSGRAADALTGYAGAKLGSQNQTAEDHDELVNQINDLTNNPEKMVAALDKSTADLFHVAPNTSQALQTTAVRATQFLSSKVPSGGAMKPLSPKYVPSPAELAKFNRYVSAVKDPVSVLDQVKSSTLTPEAIETLQTVYPKLYAEMQNQVLSELTNKVAKKQDIPYRLKMGLGMFLNQDLDNSVSQSSIFANQMALANGGMQQAKNEMNNQIKVSQTGLSKITRAHNLLTPMQQTASRGSNDS